MPQRISYWIDRRVTFHRAVGDLSAAELIEANSTVMRLVREGEAPVHHVIDARQLGKIGLHLRDLPQIVTILKEPNLGWVVMVGGNPLTRFLASVMTQSGRVKFRIVDTLNDAWHLLRRMDATLPETPPIDLRLRVG